MKSYIYLKQTVEETSNPRSSSYNPREWDDSKLNYSLYKDQSILFYFQGKMFQGPNSTYRKIIRVPTWLSLNVNFCHPIKTVTLGASLAVQWLRLYASTPGGEGSITAWGTKIPHAVQCDQKKQKTKKHKEK